MLAAPPAPPPPLPTPAPNHVHVIPAAVTRPATRVANAAHAAQNHQAVGVAKVLAVMTVAVSHAIPVPVAMEVNAAS